MTAVRTDLRASGHVPMPPDHVAPAAAPLRHRCRQSGRDSARDVVRDHRQVVRAHRRRGRAAVADQQPAAWRVRRPRGGRPTRGGRSTARARAIASLVLDRFPGDGSAVNASSRSVLTRPSGSLRCRPNERRPVMRRLRGGIATTVRHRAVSHMGPGESAVMIIPVQVCVQRWLFPPSGRHPQEGQASTPAPTD
jgi:hypothetical protein